MQPNHTLPTSPDVLIIGAGPAGSTAAALLAQRGHDVLVVEKNHFPRFVIGESLLPQAMDILAASGVLPIVQEAGFQRKDGALFTYGDERSNFSFDQGFTAGWGHTYQVQRAVFDELLATHAADAGAMVRHGYHVTGYTPGEKGPTVAVQPVDNQRETHHIQPRFVLDASGFGRVLPRLLGLLCPTYTAQRISLFAHVDDPRRDDEGRKIAICIHPTTPGIWYWLIPFSDGTASVGAVLPVESAAHYPGEVDARLRQLLSEEAYMDTRTHDVSWVKPPQQVVATAATVTQYVGPHFALLGNAGEFLDPIFSSGVTIALKSAHLAASLVHRQMRGENVSWKEEYTLPLHQGIDTFRTCVNAWYEGSLQHIIFSQRKSPRIKQMLCSILAGYAWDTNNPYVAQHQRRFKTLAELCRPSHA